MCKKKRDDKLIVTMIDLTLLSTPSNAGCYISSHQYLSLWPISCVDSDQKTF